MSEFTGFKEVNGNQFCQNCGSVADVDSDGDRTIVHCPVCSREWKYYHGDEDSHYFPGEVAPCGCYGSVQKCPHAYGPEEAGQMFSCYLGDYIGHGHKAQKAICQARWVLIAASRQLEIAQEDAEAACDEDYSDAPGDVGEQEARDDARYTYADNHHQPRGADY